MPNKRARLEDIVDRTGLSRSTVDRVLNDRPGVRAETRQRVELALNEMGYAPDALSSRLVQVAKPIHVCMVEGQNPFFSGIQAGFDRATEDLGALKDRTEIRGFDPYRPETLADLLAEIDGDCASVITVGVDNPDVARQINRLEEMGVRVITLISDVPSSKRTAFFGQDNFTAGRTAGRLMVDAVQGQTGAVAVLLGHLQFRHLLDRRSGFEQVFGLKRPDIELVFPSAYGSDKSKVTSILNLLEQKEVPLSGVYLCGGGHPDLIRGMIDMSGPPPVIIGHEVTKHSRAALEAGIFRFVVAHDVVEVSRKALEAAVAPDPRSDPACAIKIYVRENLPVH